MDANAEFFVWRGADAHRQISNVPARGFMADGEIRRSYNPNSIVYQHARMIDALVVHEKEILNERRTQQGIARERSQLAQSQVTSAPRKPLMNLDELIELEKRGGRVMSEPVTQSKNGH